MSFTHLIKKFKDSITNLFVYHAFLLLKQSHFSWFVLGKLAMQISVSLVTVIRNIHGIQERHAIAKYTTMDRCFNLEDLPGRAGYESAYLS